MNKQFADVILRFLDRVEIKGHQERQAMDQVCEPFIQIIKESQAGEVSGPVDPEAVEVKEDVEEQQ